MAELSRSARARAANEAFALSHCTTSSAVAAATLPNGWIEYTEVASGATPSAGLTVSVGAVLPVMRAERPIPTPFVIRTVQPLYWSTVHAWVVSTTVAVDQYK